MRYAPTIKKIKCQDCGTHFSHKSLKKIRCDACVNIHKKVYARKYRQEHKEEKRIEKYLPEFNQSRELFYGIKSRSKTYEDQIFDLDIKDIVIPSVCPVFGTEFIRGSRFAPSVDRIDNSKGYIKGNIQVISKLANIMKNNATQEELEKFANWVLNNKKEKKLNEKQIEDYVTEELEELTFEELLEVHDLTPQEVFILLFNHGHIDSDTLEEQMKVYNR
jgi:hypothetical protein